MWPEQEHVNGNQTWGKLLCYRVDVEQTVSTPRPPADFEGGRIKHVPSTSDMLAGALPEAGRRAASELGGALGAGLASDYESHFSSPRSDASSDQVTPRSPLNKASDLKLKVTVVANLYILSCDMCSCVSWL